MGPGRLESIRFVAVSLNLEPILGQIWVAMGEIGIISAKTEFPGDGFKLTFWKTITFTGVNSSSVPSTRGHIQSYKTKNS